jgi:hypothetical protein
MVLKKSENRRNKILEAVSGPTGKDYMLLMKRMNLVFCAVGLTLLWAAAALSAPKLTMPETVFDFGYMPQNSTVSHVFWMYSTGDDTLKIINVKTG